jgi:DNA polymerase elongation subunit (family B)
MGYNNEGAPVKEKIRFAPELFIERAGGEFHTLKKTSCVRKEFDTMNDCYDFVKTHKDVYNLYGCSDFVRQFTGRHFRGELKPRNDLIQVWFFDIETKIGGGATGEIDEEGNDILSKGGFPDPKSAAESISLITMYNRSKKQITTWGLYAIDAPDVNSKQTEEQIQEDIDWIRSKNVDYRMFSDETSMLKDFLMFVKTNRLDILSGWNSEFFDVPYLYNRLVNLLGEALAAHLSPWKIVNEHKKFVNDKEKLTYEIVGVGHVDLLDLYKKFNPGSKESFALGFIADVELGVTKVELPGEDFKDSYENYWSTFVKYNIVDVLLLDDLDKKKQIVDLCMSIAYMAKCNYEDVVSAMRTWESLIYNHFLDLDIVEDWTKPHSKKLPLEGAYVHVPKPGAYRWVVSVDATSMYPSIMMQNNLSPETIQYKIDYTVQDVLDGKIPELKSNEILSCNGLVTRSDISGFIPILTKQVFDGRKEAKNKMLDLKKIVKSIENALEKSSTESDISALNMKQNVLKVLGNSLYGVCSLQHFRYYNHYIAEAITLSGQAYLKLTMKIINDVLNKLCGTVGKEYAFYGDTDSIFFTADAMVKKMWSNKTDDEIVAALEKFVMKVLQPEINDKLSVLTKKMGAPENYMFFKLEGISKNAIWLAKKRYIAALRYNEGVWYNPPEMKIMGMEIVRSSTPKFIKEQLRKAVQICIDGEESDLQKFVSVCKSDFIKKDVEDISFPRGCNGLGVYSDEKTIYKSGTPIHVRAALMHNHIIHEKNLSTKIQAIGDGDKIKFVHLKMPNPIHENIIGYTSKLPVEFGLHKYVDKNMMFEKGFVGPLEGVLKAIGWTSEEQNTLDF